MHHTNLTMVKQNEVPDLSPKEQSSQPGSRPLERRCARAIAIFFSAALLLPTTHAALQQQPANVESSSDDSSTQKSPPIEQTAAAQPLSIDELFSQLHHKKFAVRQTATETLIERGGVVLPEIARRYFDSSPESIYRMRKILEGISSGQDEAVFLRATGLLLALYPNGNRALAKRIVVLKSEWERRRRQAAKQALVDAGATVESALNNQQRFLQDVVRQNQLPSNPAPLDKKTSKTVTVTQKREMAAEVMANSMQLNREFIVKNTPSLAPADRSPFQYSSSVRQAISITFPVAWKVDPKILNRLQQVGDPINLSLRESQLTAQHWTALKQNNLIASMSLSKVDLPATASQAFPEAVRRITLDGYALDEQFCKSLKELRALNVLELENCLLDELSAKWLDQLPRVSSIPIKFHDITVDEPHIAPLSQLKRARVISMQNVKVTNDALEELEDLNQISVLMYSSMNVDQSLIDSASRMKRLRQFDLMACKFDVEAYERLLSNNQIRATFHPKAFLGVGPRGTGRDDLIGCQIALVSPNSSAEAAGIEVNDIIKSINGVPVNTFQEVRFKIAQHDPGEKMKIQVLRGNKTVNLEAKLGENVRVPPF